MSIHQHIEHSPRLTRDHFLALVEAHLPSAVQIVQAYVIDTKPTEEIHKIIAKIFLRYAASYTSLNTPQKANDARSLSSFHLSCCAIAELAPYVNEDKCPALTVINASLSFKGVARRKLPSRATTVLWLLAQLQLSNIASSSREAKWMFERFAAICKISAAAVRKLRQRIIEACRGSRNLQSAVDKLADDFVRVGLAIRFNSTTEMTREVPGIDLDSVERFLRNCSSGDLTTADDYIQEIDSHGLSPQISRNTREVLVEHLNLQRGVKISVVSTRLFHRLGKITEKLNASASWLFRMDHSRQELVAEISNNSDLSTGQNKLTMKVDRGIVGYVASTRRPFCTGNVNDVAFYAPLNVGTISELAVPIFSPSTGILLGVINLESSKPNWFSMADALRLQSMVLELVPDLIIFAQLQTLPAELGSWHFRTDGWSIDQTLSAFCDCVRTSLRQTSGLKTAAMVWQYDFEKDCFFMRGTSGYEYEYATTRIVPANSFTGLVFRDRKPVIATLEEAKRMGFQRPLKAEAINVTWLAACPIGRDGVSQQPWGVFSIYGFRSNERVDVNFLQEISNLIAEAAASWERVRFDAAQSFAALKMSRVPSVGNPRNEAARDLIQELFNADGVSLFLKDRPKRLVCVATTGLETADGDPVVNLNEAQYDLSIDGGATVTMAKSPGSILRRIDAADDQEPIRSFPLPNTIQFENRFRETASWTPMERRRFLGVAVLNGDKQPVVVRLVRRSGSRPFHDVDAVLLRDVLQTIADDIRIPRISQNIDRYRRFIHNRPCQLDVRVGALLQESLRMTRPQAYNRISLAILRVINGQLESSVVYSDSIGRRDFEESPLWTATPQFIFSNYFRLKGFNSGIFVVRTTAGGCELLIFFTTPYLDAQISWLLRVPFGSQPPKPTDVEPWVSLSHALAVCIATNGIQSDDNVSCISSTITTLFKYMTARRPIIRGTQKVWSPILLGKQGSALRGISLGPTVLGYVPASTSLSTMIHLLRGFVSENVKSKCAPVNKSSVFGRWKVLDIREHVRLAVARSAESITSVQ